MRVHHFPLHVHSHKDVLRHVRLRPPVWPQEVWFVLPRAQFRGSGVSPGYIFREGGVHASSAFWYSTRTSFDLKIMVKREPVGRRDYRDDSSGWLTLTAPPLLQGRHWTDEGLDRKSL